MSDPTLLILASLADGEKHGYAMMEDIERFADIRGPGTLYGAITRLEERGLIRPVAPADRRQPYAITAAGRKVLEEQTRQSRPRGEDGSEEASNTHETLAGVGGQTLSETLAQSAMRQSSLVCWTTSTPGGRICWMCCEVLR